MIEQRVVPLAFDLRCGPRRDPPPRTKQAHRRAQAGSVRRSRMSGGESAAPRGWKHE